MSLRPFFPYYGSKWNVARYYPAPKFDLVIEPFAGGAGYSTFYGCRKVMLIDADPIIVGLWQYLMSVSPADVMALPELPEVGDSVDNYQIPQEAKWLIGFWLNRGSAQPKKTRTAYSARTDKAQLNWGLRAKQRVAGQLHALEGWIVRQGSYDTVGYWGDATWFVDPPYVDKGKFYRIGFDDYEALGRWCRGQAGQVIACEGVGATWLPFQPMGTFKSSTGKALEQVWMAQQ